MLESAKQAYTDSFEHTVDAKGRVTVPKEWRGEGFSDRLQVFPSQEGCLKVYPASFLSLKMEKLADAPMGDPRRKSLERLSAIAQSTSLDPQNRISIKEKLRNGVGIKKMAVLVGRLDHFELWDSKKWKSMAQEDLTIEEVAQEAGL